MAFANLSFELGTVTPKLPDNWAATVNVTSVNYASFGGTDASEAESFESTWLSNEAFVFAFSGGNLAAGSFDTAGAPEAREDFEELWDGNESFLFAWGASAAASFDTAGVVEAAEDFEELWLSNEAFSFTMGATTAASFDTAGTPEAPEDFEELWDGNEAFSFTMGATTAASFDSGGTPEAVEDFEETKFPIAFTVTAATDVCTATAHGFVNGDKVTIKNEGGILPDGLQPLTEYLVMAAAANTFQLSLDGGVTAVDISTIGSGVHYVVADPRRFWTTLLT